MSFEQSFLARRLRGLAWAVSHHPRWFVYPQLFLAGLCVVFSTRRLELDINPDHLVSPRVGYQQRWLQFRREFPAQEPHLVLVESGERWRSRRFLERLAGRLESHPNLFSDVFYKMDLQTLGPKGLLLASPTELEQLRQSVHEYAPVLRELTQTTNLNGLFGFINAQFRAGGAAPEGNTERLARALPFLEQLVAEAHRSLLESNPPGAAGLESFLGGPNGEVRPYLTLDEGRLFVLMVRPRNPAVVAAGIEQLRAALQATQQEVAGVNVGLTGELVLNYDELRQAKRDSVRASVVALLLCALLFAGAYRELSRPLKAALCLLVGFGYTLGFAALSVGHLNIMTVGFAPMLVGLANHLGVHLMSRYEEEMRQRRPVGEALGRALVHTGQGMVLGGVAMAAAFLAMVFTPFQGIRELGLICGAGLLFCLVPMLTMLPALLLRGRQNERDYAIGPAGEARLRMEQVWLQHPLWAAGLTALVCVGASFGLGRVGFDDNLLRLQSPSLDSVRYEHKLLQAAGHSVISAAVIADSPQQARAFEARLRALPAVVQVDSLAQYVTPDQGQKLALVRAVQRELGGIRAAPADLAPPRLDELNATLWSLGGYLAWAADLVQAHNPALAKEMWGLRARIGELRATVVSGQPQVARQLGAYQVALFTQWRRGLEALQGQDTRGPLRVEDLPPVLRGRFVGVSGKRLLQVYPRKDLWQGANQAEFLHQLRQAVPAERVTGEAVQLYEGTALLRRSYERAAWYALGAILLLLWVHFRSPGLVLLALLPVGIGALWLLGFMGGCALAFNPANLLALPLVLGIGVTNGIHVLNRFAEERHAALLARSTGKAVLVSGLTAMAGFGALLLAQHQGLRSLGEVMAAGIATCLCAALVSMPALLSLLLEHAQVRPFLRRHLHGHLGWHRNEAPEALPARPAPALTLIERE